MTTEDKSLRIQGITGEERRFANPGEGRQEGANPGEGGGGKRTVIARKA